MQISFLGSIGHLMAGLGLQELLEVVLTGNAVRHMLTGKAISREVRGHMLVDAALNTILVANAYHIPLPTKETDKPKRDTASTDPENDDVETDQQNQGTVDVTSDILYCIDSTFALQSCVYTQASLVPLPRRAPP